jgi:Zn-dependent peptidase ImmA (M78 family)/transcriptional regulator with XRE-family HTH domain
MAPQFNHGLLRVARQRSRFPQGEAADRLQVPQVSLSRYETGAALPKEGFSARAAEVYDLPETFFFQPDSPIGAPVSVHPMWRKKHDVTTRELDGIVAEINLRIMHIRRLLDAVDHQPRTDIPRLDLEDFDSDPEKIAALVRAHWMVPRGPFANLTAAVELAGAIVVHSYLGESAVSGVKVAVPGMPPVIVLNKDQPADRMRFTLAHELGHLVMHRFPTNDMEREANNFASALLMPADDVKIALSGRIDLRRLAALKPEWRVSMQGLLYRAQTLGLIGKAEAGWLWRQFNTNRIKLREPPELDFSVENPGVMNRIVNLHLTNLGFTITELASALHIHEATFAEMYPDQKPEPVRGIKLRVVS